MLKRIIAHMGKLIVALWSVTLALFLVLVSLWFLDGLSEYGMIKPLVLAIVALLMINAIVQGIWSFIDPEMLSCLGSDGSFRKPSPPRAL